MSSREILTSKINSIFGELSGENLEGVPPEVSFVELGFDSLFLTQAAGRLKREFKVKVTFRQLLEECDSVSKLATHIQPLLSADLKAQFSSASSPSKEQTLEPSDSSPVSRSNGPPASENDLQFIVNEQLRLMDMQIQLLRKRATNTSLKASKEAPENSVSQELDRLKGKPLSSDQHGPYRNISKSDSPEDLSSQQRSFLEWLVSNYENQSPKSKSYTTRHRKHLADPRAVAGFKPYWKEIVYPIVSKSSKGSKIWDLDGNEWIDVTMGFGVALLGHSPDFINDAIKAQLESGVEIGPQSPLAGEVAELICEFTNMDRVTFCNTGSEAVMATLRICRTVTGRNRIALFAGAYHGTFDEVLVKGAMVNGQPKTLPLAPGVMPGHIGEVTVLEYGSPDSLEWLRKNASDLAAMLVEPVQSRHPGLQPKEFLESVSAITKEAETPLIFDEVITGFRSHPGGAQSYFGIEADIATYGKVVGGGMPFGFIAGKSEYMDALDGGQWSYGDDSFPETGVTFYAGTFVRHPLAMASAKAMLLHLKEAGPTLQSDLADKTAAMIDELNRYFMDHQIPMNLERFTSIWYPHFESTVTQSSLLYYILREKGLHIWEGRPCFLSTEHSETEIEFIIDAFKQSLAEMQLGGFIGGTSNSHYKELAMKRTALTSTPSDPGQPTGNSFASSDAQREIWLAVQMDEDASRAFNESCSVELSGELDSDALELAVKKLVSRHESLRSRFSEDGQTQFVDDARAPVLETADLTHLDERSRSEKLADIQNGACLRTFNLAEGPLCHFSLVKLSAGAHVLLITAHHLICDGWSFDVAMRELSVLYSSYQRKSPPSLPDAFSFREFVKWEKDQKVQDQETQSYWHSLYETLPANLELPIDRARPKRRSFSGARNSLRIEKSISRMIKESAKAHRSTLFSSLLSAFATLLNRLSGQTDLVIGVPAAGQNAIAESTLIGHCANLLPIRLQIDSESPYLELLSKVKTATLDAFEHQTFTFNDLLLKLEIERDPSRIPLVSVMFNLDPQLSDIDFTGLEHSISVNPRRAYQFELGFNIVDEEEGLLIECDYNTDLFDSASIDRWLNRFKVLLSSICETPSNTISRLNLLPAEERQQIVENWNDTQSEYPSNSPLHELFENQARETPDAIAASFENRSVSYKELDDLSNRLAMILIGKGVAANSLVGVYLERSIDMLVAILGILKAGSAYVPLDPAFPTERVSMMIEDSGMPVIISHSSLGDAIPDSNAMILRTDDLPQRDKPSVIKADTNTRNRAYVIFTSGSTGRPKGVPISHNAVVNFLCSMKLAPGFAAKDTLVAITTLSFDISILELFLPLVSGGQVIIASREDTMDGNRLMRLLRTSDASVVQGTPATWRMLIDSGWEGDKRLKVLCGGEAMNQDLADQLLDRCSQLWNMYGPTETTIWSTIAKILPGDTITIGRPIANTQIYILDKNMALSPIGTSGELYIGGDGLALGYLNNPELTSEKFVPNPFSETENDLIYNTGDIASYMPDGRIRCHGRIDNQVKVRGFRIELGDIESGLSKHPSIRDVAVAIKPDHSNENILVAYIVSDDSSSLKAGSLRSYLRDSLPDYMIPSIFVPIDRLPKTPNGKIDRKSLPDADDQRLESKEHHIEPRTDTERLIAETWKDVLNIDRIGVEDDFFDLGGHSILAMRVATRLRKSTDANLKMSVLFDHPSVAAMAKHLENLSLLSKAVIKKHDNSKEREELEI